MEDRIPESHPDLQEYWDEVRLILEQHADRKQFVIKRPANAVTGEPATVPIQFTRGDHALASGGRALYARDREGRRIYTLQHLKTAR